MAKRAGLGPFTQIKPFIWACMGGTAAIHSLRTMEDVFALALVWSVRLRVVLGKCLVSRLGMDFIFLICIEPDYADFM